MPAACGIPSDLPICMPLSLSVVVVVVVEVVITIGGADVSSRRRCGVWGRSMGRPRSGGVPTTRDVRGDVLSSRVRGYLEQFKEGRHWAVWGRGVVDRRLRIAVVVSFATDDPWHTQYHMVMISSG